MSNKVYVDACAALEDILFDGMSIMAGGFGACGIPDLCIQEIRRRQIRDLKIISNNCGGEYVDRPGKALVCGRGCRMDSSPGLSVPISAPTKLLNNSI